MPVHLDSRDSSIRLPFTNQLVFEGEYKSSSGLNAPRESLPFVRALSKLHQSVIFNQSLEMLRFMKVEKFDSPLARQRAQIFTIVLQ